MSIENQLWSEKDFENIAVSRGIALDILSKAGSGHTGATLSLTPVLYLLLQKIMIHNPSDPEWESRDKLVLSCGHASLALYIQLHLAGYSITSDELKQFRQLNSNTPGHPEYSITPGIETTTGPLGQGFGNAVGLALSEKMRSQEDGIQNHNRKIFCVVSDGDLQEGVSFESASLAAHYELSNLIVIFDSNEISIDGPVAQSTSINIEDYFRALGWKVTYVPKIDTGEIDLIRLANALTSQSDPVKPHLIILQSEIGWPSPTYKATAYIHGNLLPTAEVEEIKKILGLEIYEELGFLEESIERSKLEIMKRCESRGLSTSESDNLHRLDLDKIASRIEGIEFPEKISTRKANGIILGIIKEIYPWTLGGSADLTESNGLSLNNLYNPKNKINGIANNLVYGVREHAMSSISNGLALNPHNIVYCATYLGFSDYQKPAVRLSALMRLPVTYIWTHDSIALGADGPTHQPIEHLAALRAIPDFAVIRPGSAQELKDAWIKILKDRKPVGLVLSRQDLVNRKIITTYPQAVEKGAYVYAQNFKGEDPNLVLIATGSELELAMQILDSKIFQELRIRIVSMPCWEWFTEESLEYQELVLGKEAVLCVSLEAGSTFGWERFTGRRGLNIGINTFGASGSSEALMEKFGFTFEAIESRINRRLNELGMELK